MVKSEKKLDRAEAPRELRPFLDDEGRLKAWPSRQKVQRMAAVWLVQHFEAGHEYSEREVNELLNTWHTFEDWALLRRMLYDWRFLDREPDGSRYRLRPAPPELAA
jgi:hypothetical protein